MSKNPTTITILTPDGEKTLRDVETWWRESGDLVVQHIDGDERRFPLGEVISGQ
jgi:hypothetical protein